MIVGALAIAGVAVIAAGALAAFGRGGVTVGLWLQTIGAALLGVAGCVVFADGTPVGAGFRAGWHPGVGIDPLSGFFLLVIAVSAIPVLIYALQYVPSGAAPRAIVGLGGGFLFALVGVVCTRDVLGFLACWELMTLLPAAAILIARPQPHVRRVIVEYLTVTHLGGTGVWVAMLVLAEHGVLGGADLAAHSQALVAVVGVAALVGFGSKAGLVPLQMWLPRTHPVAPSHLSALMSGVMVKIALYGLIRVLFWWLAPAPVWLGIALMAVGAVSALGGILAAIVQDELKRLLAYSTIENVGMIALALGTAVVLAASGARLWADLALAGALLHVLNHAVMKAGLFLSAGSVERATGEHGLDHLGGLLRRMPWTGAAFGMCILGIAGLPMLAGFASEWLILEALVHGVILAGAAAAIASVLALIAMAAAIGVGAACFVKLGGLALLGRPRSESARDASEVGIAMRAGVVMLAGACVVLGAIPGLLVGALVRLQPIPVTVGTHAGLWLPGTGGLPTLGLVVVVGLATLVLVRVRGARTAAAPVWICGQPDDPSLAWTAAGFSSSLLMSVGGLVRTDRTVERTTGQGVLTEVRHAQYVHDRVEARIYRPVQRIALELAALARRLQSGSLQAYVGYFVALLIVMLVIARLAGA